MANDWGTIFAESFSNSYTNAKKMKQEADLAIKRAALDEAGIKVDMLKEGFLPASPINAPQTEQDYMAAIKSINPNAGVNLATDLTPDQRLAAMQKFSEQVGVPKTPEVFDFGALGKYIKGGASKSKKEELNRASVLRKEFNAAQVAKDYNTIKRAYKGLETAYNASVDPDSKSRIASDQALGVLFQKQLDPDSVVRESEYARTPEGAAFLHRMESIAPQLAKGGLRLTNEDRKAILDQSRALFESAAEAYNGHYDRYGNLAELYSVDPEMIYGGIQKLDFSNNGSKSVGVSMEINLPNGETFTIGEE